MLVIGLAVVQGFGFRSNRLTCTLVRTGRIRYQRLRLYRTSKSPGKATSVQHYTRPDQLPSARPSARRAGMRGWKARGCHATGRTPRGRERAAAGVMLVDGVGAWAIRCSLHVGNVARCSLPAFQAVSTAWAQTRQQACGASQPPTLRCLPRRPCSPRPAHGSTAPRTWITRGAGWSVAGRPWTYWPVGTWCRSLPHTSSTGTAPRQGVTSGRAGGSDTARALVVRHPQVPGDRT